MRPSFLVTCSLVLMLAGHASASPQEAPLMTCPQAAQIAQAQDGLAYTAPGGWKGDSVGRSVDLARVRFTTSHLTAAGVLCRYEGAGGRLSLKREGSRLAVGSRWINAECKSDRADDCPFQ